MRENSYDYAELIKCSQGKLFSPDSPKLPQPNMLMLDKVSSVNDTGGVYGKGEIIGELALNPDLWFFGCHFIDDPVMPGCLGLDALWQMLGFYLAWCGLLGTARASGCGKVKFSGEILPKHKKVTYHVHIKKISNMSKVTVGFALGNVYVDDVKVYVAEDLQVALFHKA